MNKGCSVLLILVLVVIGGSCGLNHYVESIDPTLEKAPPFPLVEILAAIPAELSAIFRDIAGGDWKIIGIGIVGALLLLIAIGAIRIERR